MVALPLSNHLISQEHTLIQSLHNLLEENVAVLCLSRKMGTIHELGGTFSKIAATKRYRFVSTYNLEELPTHKFTNLISAIDIDYTKLQKQAQQIKRALDLGSEVKVVTDVGTQLTINIQGMTAHANDAKEITAQGNMPVGEVYVAPKRNLVDGILVIDGSARTKTGTIIVNKPITVTIEKGNVTRVSGGEEASQLRETLRFYLKKNIMAKRVCELGIGINPGATVCGPTIINEKSLGTAHIAFGNNKSFGGTINAPNHLDQVFKKPRIYIDGKLIRI
jgi:leucyl aminopeptidase (aminopeptidase T)